MERNRPQRRVRIDQSQLPKYDAVEEEENGMRLRPSNSNMTEDQEPFMGVKVRRKASLHRDYKGDYIDVGSHPFLIKLLQKQGDRHVLFADKVLKFTGSGKMKRRIILITDVAIYILDPETDALKRRIDLAAVDKMCLSELSDNFFAIVIPRQYDLLMASTRKTEIVTVLVEAIKDASDSELEVVFSNRFPNGANHLPECCVQISTTVLLLDAVGWEDKFLLDEANELLLKWHLLLRQEQDGGFEYHAAADLVKEVQFEEVEGGVKTRIVRK